MHSKLISIVKNQKGFTLVELIIAIAITGLIVGGIALTITQLFVGHAQSSGKITALTEVQNAGYHISRDAQMAATVNDSDDPETSETTEVLTITRTYYWSWKTEEREIEGEPVRDISLIINHKVIYTLDNGRLDRNEYRTPIIREDDPIEYSPYSVTQIARYITFFEYNLGSNILTVTAETGGFGSQTETRTYEIDPRPDAV